MRLTHYGCGSLRTPPGFGPDVMATIPVRRQTFYSFAHITRKEKGPDSGPFSFVAGEGVLAVLLSDLCSFHLEYRLSYGPTVFVSRVTAVPANSLPFIVAPVFMAIDV